MISKVSSASRLSQPQDWLSIPTSMVSAEDIHYGGHTSIPDALQFVPGLDVQPIDNVDYAVGVRGLHDPFGDRVLRMVDGRVVSNSALGSGIWAFQPVAMEDIERIEVVRGPGGAAWGINAMSGVINVITKEPKDVLGLLASTTVDHFGQTSSHARWAAENGRWSWLTSVGLRSRRTSEATVGASYTSSSPQLNGLIGFSDFQPEDDARVLLADGKAIYEEHEGNRVSLGGSVSRGWRGPYEHGGYFPRRRMETDLVRAFARWDRQVDQDTGGYLLWYGELLDIEWPQFLNMRTLTNQLEGQLDFVPAPGHRTALGLSVRGVHLDARRESDQQYQLTTEPVLDTRAGGFLTDRWSVTDRLEIESQARLDWYSGTGLDWAGRLTGLYALDEPKRHILRLSGAQAFRTPLRVLQDAYGGRVQHPVSGHLINIEPADGLHNEETGSIEGGYTFRATPELVFRTNGYWQCFRELVGQTTRRDAFGRNWTKLDNLGGARAYGAEAEVEYETKRGRLAAWYTWHAMHEGFAGQDLRAFMPAKHRAGVAGWLHLPGGWTLSAKYRYADHTPRNPASKSGMPVDHRLDLTVSRELLDGKAEIMVGVHDVLDRTASEAFSNGRLAAHETPGRTFFIRLQVRF